MLTTQINNIFSVFIQNLKRQMILDVSTKTTSLCLEYYFYGLGDAHEVIGILMSCVAYGFVSFLLEEINFKLIIYYASNLKEGIYEISLKMDKFQKI